MNLAAKRSGISWPILVVGAIIVTVISLSVHVIMLQVWGVPFPDRTGVALWANFLNVAIAVIALSTFYGLARPQMTRWPTWLRWLVVALLFGSLKEVFRGNLMNGVVTTAWVFSFAQMIAPIAYSLILGACVVWALPLVRNRALGIGAMLVAAAFMMFAVKPLVGFALSPLMQAVSALNHQDVYPFPYGWHVLFWAYVTYLEPVMACFAAAALVLPGLSPRPILRITQFSGLILCIKGALLPTLLFGFFNARGLGIGMISESQFLLEGLALSVLVALIWPSATRQVPRERRRAGFSAER